MTADDLADLLLAAYGQSSFAPLLARFRDRLNEQVVIRLRERADALSRQNAHTALEIGKAALAVAREIGTPQAMIPALWAQGNALIYLGRYRAALDRYRQVEALLRQTRPDSLLELARLRTNHMAARQGMGDYARALELAQEARMLYESLGESARRYLAGLEMNMGVLYRQVGDLDAALAAYERGRDLAERIGDPSLAARLDINRANILEEMDCFVEAEDLLLAARSTLIETGLHQEAARADLNLGRLAHRRGRYLEALRYLEEAGRRFAAIPIPVDEAVVKLRRSFVYRDLALLPEAIALAAEAEAVFRQNDLPWYRALALLNRGMGYRQLGEHVQAERLLNRVRRLFSQLGAEKRVLLLDVDRAALALAAGRPQTARRIARRVIHHLDPATRPTPVARLHLLLAQCARQDDTPRPDLVRSQVEAALALAQEYNLPEIRIQGDYLLGQLAEDEGARVAAWRHYRAAIRNIEELRGRLPADRFQLGFMADKLPVYRAGLRVGHHLASAEQILSLLDLLHAAPLPPLCPTPIRSEDPLDAELRALREEWHWYGRRQEAADRLTETPAAEQLLTESALRQRRRELEIRIADLTYRRQAQIAPESGAFPGRDPDALLSEATAAEFLARLQAHLPSQSLLVHYYRTEGQVHALLVGRQTLRRVTDLGSAGTVGRLLRSWRFQVAHIQALQTAPESATSLAMTHLSRLFRLLIAPLVPFLVGQRHLYFVLPPEWYDLPLAACLDGRRYLVEDFTLSLLSAPRALWQSPCPASPSAEKGPGKALILGYSDGGRLPNALTEARQVAGAVRPRLTPILCLETEATQAQVYQAGPHCRLLHLATHALFRPDNPLFSWIRLADARLTVAEWYEITLLRRPLVVLSACETGRGRPQGGGLLGMGRSLLTAGASGLVVSLWKVADQSTVSLMSEFYAHLDLTRPAHGAAQALAQAQRAAIVRGLSPFHWAGFTFVRG